MLRDFRRRVLACGGLLLLAAMTVSPAVAEAPAGATKEGELAPSLGIEEAAWREKLNETVDLTYEAEPLETVVAELAAQFRIPLQIDRAALDDAGLGTDVPITLTLSSVSFKAALNIMLKEYDLTWTILNEQLTITTPAEAEKSLITRVYAVGDLVRLETQAGIAVVNVGRSDDYEPLIGIITSTILPYTWDDVGGYASIGAYESADSLVISHTWQTHEDIVGLLETLRAAKELTDTAAEEELDENGQMLRVYRVYPPRQEIVDSNGEQLAQPNAEAWTRDLAETIVEFIEPESWEETGGPGKMRAAAGMLFVRQTPEVQSQIQAVLNNAFAETYPAPAPHGQGGFGQQF